MVRIRYTNNNGLLKSKPVIAGTEVITVCIEAKKELKNIGGVFSDEVRNRSA